jgi:riboflavin synthase alpha subunit
MFSGIVERTGIVESVTPDDAGVRIRIRAAFGGDPAPGASVSVNGVCLTVERASAGTLEFVAVAETLRRTSLGALAPLAGVNLERALRVGDELGGHWVQGHVDGVGTVASVDWGGDDARVAVEVPPPLRRYVAEKGSITIDGVSLTVAAWNDPRLTVALVPYTLEHTTASSWNPGARVNLEVDIVARYLERLLAARVGNSVAAGSGAEES